MHTYKYMYVYMSREREEKKREIDVCRGKIYTGGRYIQGEDTYLYLPPTNILHIYIFPYTHI